MAALQNCFWDPIKMRLPDTMAVSVTSCKVHRILCTDIPILSTSCKPTPARPRFAAEFTQESDRRNVHRSGVTLVRGAGRDRSKMLGRELEMKRGREPTCQRKRFSVFNRLIVLIACVILVIVLLSHAGSFLVLNVPRARGRYLGTGQEPIVRDTGTQLNCRSKAMRTGSCWMQASLRRCTESPKPTWPRSF